MPLPSEYTQQACSLARALEIVGERWTLLIVRDAFYGARRFGEFHAHLQIPRASLSDRLSSLVDAGILARSGDGRTARYDLTDKGLSLWPVVHTLMQWGDEHYAPGGPRRIFVHAEDEEPIGPGGICDACGTFVEPGEILLLPGPGLEPPTDGEDAISAALREPHRMLSPF